MEQSKVAVQLELATAKAEAKMMEKFMNPPSLMRK